MMIRRKIQPLDTMKHIPISMVMENFDQITATINNEQAGVVIDNPYGHDYVMCPYGWFKNIFDDDFGSIIICALRYAINRKTYMPGIVVEYIRKHIRVLDTRTIGVILKDIEVALQEETVDDPVIWEMLRTELIAQLKELYEQSQRKD